MEHTAGLRDCKYMPHNSEQLGDVPDSEGAVVVDREPPSSGARGQCESDGGSNKAFHRG